MTLGKVTTLKILAVLRGEEEGGATKSFPFAKYNETQSGAIFFLESLRACIEFSSIVMDDVDDVTTYCIIFQHPMFSLLKNSVFFPLQAYIAFVK